MTARDKIRGLTNAWYGYSLAAAVLGLVQGGIGVLSIVGTLLSLAVSFTFIWFVGNRLLAKSSTFRTLMIIISGLATAIAGVGVAKMGWMFLHDWSLRLLVGIFFGGAWGYMNLRSLRTLTDSSVKAYFA
jgi:hypothetical protein